ncbi:hypothetical protein B0H19DRAFT_1245613 [Mycena capillaripes]|nr:hypothetical protein B0H19DRAFT_1245613 [Mycena capillaripes]
MANVLPSSPLLFGQSTACRIIRLQCLGDDKRLGNDKPISRSRNNFWDKLDDHLSQIRHAAKGDKKKIVSIPLGANRRSKQARRQDYVLDENVVDTFQQEVDDLLAIDVADAATSAETEDSNT